MKKTKSDRFCRATEVRVNKNTKISLSGKTNISKHQEIVLPLPDGTYLKAVAITDENFPAINIYWNCGKSSEEIICFAEYNPERSPCHEVCIGAYQSDKDDTTYYKPYMAERDSNEEN